MTSAVDSLTAFTGFVLAWPLGVIATTDTSGGPEAALVSFAVTAAGDLLFDTRTETRKMANIGHDPRVAVVIGCCGDVSIQVEGVAVIESGAGRDAAAREYEARFPGSHALAEGFAIVRVRPSWLRHYDAGAEPVTVAEGPPSWSADAPGRDGAVLRPAAPRNPA